MIQVTSDNPDMIYLSTMDVHGGKMINVSLSQEVVDTLRWAQSFRKKHELELELRKTVPALASQYEQYQTMLRIVMDTV